MSDLETRVKALEERVSALEKAPNEPASQTPTKKQSPKEFLLSMATKSVVENTLALAYYHEVVSAQGAFNTDDIEALFRAAKEKPPTNMGDMVNKNIKKGYLMEDTAKKDAKKAWVLTSTGEQYVQKLLEPET